MEIVRKAYKRTPQLRWQQLGNATSFPNHTVDETDAATCGAPVVPLDETRGVLLATQIIGNSRSRLYSLPLRLGDNHAYSYFRFVPSCAATRCIGDVFKPHNSPSDATCIYGKVRCGRMRQSHLLMRR